MLIITGVAWATEDKPDGQAPVEQPPVGTGAMIELPIARLLPTEEHLATWLSVGDEADRRGGNGEPHVQGEPEKPRTRSPLHRLGVTVTLLSEFEHNTFQEEQAYQKYKNLVDFVGHRGKWHFGAQLRSLVFSDQMRVLPDNYEQPKKFGVYRKYIEYVGEGIHFRAGDFNQSLGNGLTLYLQQDPALRLDHTIDGGRVGVKWKWLEALFLGGVIDQVTNDAGGIEPQLLASGHQDKLIGLRVVGRLPRQTMIGINLNRFEYEGREANRQQSGSVEFKASGVLNRLDVAGEVAFTQRRFDNPGFTGLSEHGRAIYLSATGYALGATALVEYKNYRDFESPYVNPPNLGRVDDLIANQNVRGFRARVDRTFIKTGTTAFFSYTQQNSVQSTAPFSFPLPNFSTLIFGGVEQSLQDDRWFIQVVIGRRYEKDVGLDETHTTVDVTRRLGGRHSVGFNYDGRHTKLFLIQKHDDRFVFSYGVSPYVIFSLLLARQQNVSRESGEQLEEKYFTGPEVVFTPTSSWLVKVFVGQRPGGLVCSGGICREETPFRGFRSTVSYRF
ncbi:MAG: hypothetical protein RMM98_12440 [Acidobacteriota bacterium]|nr:hypothetical protein [Blastocatellia bacterium]MDW8240418.1 hypothetical protein [Acidobacteriota bacterium]